MKAKTDIRFKYSFIRFAYDPPVFIPESLYFYCINFRILCEVNFTKKVIMYCTLYIAQMAEIKVTENLYIVRRRS